MKRTRAESDRWFDVVLETADAQAAVMALTAGQSTGGPGNAHTDSDQWLYVISGAGWAIVDGEDHSLTAGDLVCIEAGETHEVGADPDQSLETLNLYVPPEY